jgi:hypothetical protein
MGRGGSGTFAAGGGRDDNEPPAMPVISITRVRVRSWRFLPAFALRTVMIARQLARAEGNLGVALLHDKRNTFWTGTSWSSEESIKTFMHTAPHGPAMRKLLNWCDEAALVHWTQAGAELPSWEGAHRRIQAEGRPSKVNHPSPIHTAHVFPVPVVGQSRALKVK